MLHLICLDKYKKVKEKLKFMKLKRGTLKFTFVHKAAANVAVRMQIRKRERASFLIVPNLILVHH